MPFVLRHVESKERLDLSEVDRPRDLNPRDFECPLCNAGVVIKAGDIKAVHFAHRVPCTSALESHPESVEHRQGKVFLRELLKGTEMFSTARFALEVPIPEANRITDLCMELPSGQRIACEVQLASITTQTLQERTNDYLRAGVDSFWFLGKTADTPANRAWCLDHQGWCYSFEFSKPVVHHPGIAVHTAANHPAPLV